MLRSSRAQGYPQCSRARQEQRAFSSRSLGGDSPTICQTADWKSTLTVIPRLPGDPPALSEPRSGNQLDPACVMRTGQADSSAAKAGAGASLRFVHLCMRDTSAEV